MATERTPCPPAVQVASPTPAGTRITCTVDLPDPHPGGPARGGHPALASLAAPAGAAPDDRLLVIHGRDEALRIEFFDLLRALGLVPLEWEPLVAITGRAAPTLLEVVGTALARQVAQAVIVLLTPDDIVRLHPDLHEVGEHRFEVEARLQPRPNVLIEAGMALATYPDATILVEFGGGVKLGSDLAGLNTVRFTEANAADAAHKLVQRLRRAGCAVDDRGSDWRSPHRLTRLAAYRRHPCGAGCEG